MHRLFVGIDPPLAIKQQLLAVEGGISAARWQREDQLHLTLRFIGEVDRRTANDIAALIPSVTHPRFMAQASGVGSFEKRGIIHTLYAGVMPGEPFHILHKKLDHMLVQLGLAAEPRAYVPHITLARLNSGSGTIAHFLSAHAALKSATFLVPDICLYESQLTREGPHYHIVERFALDQCPH